MIEHLGERQERKGEQERVRHQRIRHRKEEEGKEWTARHNEVLLKTLKTNHVTDNLGEFYALKIHGATHPRGTLMHESTTPTDFPL